MWICRVRTSVKMTQVDLYLDGGGTSYCMTGIEWSYATGRPHLVGEARGVKVTFVSLDRDEYLTSVEVAIAPFTG